MVSDSAATSPASDSTGIGSSNTVINGLLGGVAGVVLAFLPFSPLLGGAVAGYLDAGGPDGGLRAGLIAGLVMLVPFVLGIAFVLFMIGFGGPAGFGVLAILVLLLGAAYTVGLGVLGGYVGDYIAREL